MVHLPERHLFPDCYRVEFPCELVDRFADKPLPWWCAYACLMKGKWLGRRLHLHTKGLFFPPRPT